MTGDPPKDFNGYTVKEILQNFILPEIRAGNEKFERFIENDYQPFKDSTNRWRWGLAGGMVFLSLSLTILGILTRLHEIHLL